jgi:hypothetical protein
LLLKLLFNKYQLEGASTNEELLRHNGNSIMCEWALFVLFNCGTRKIQKKYLKGGEIFAHKNL